MRQPHQHARDTLFKQTYPECFVVLVCNNSLQGSDVAPRDGPLDIQIPPAAGRDAVLLLPSFTPDFFRYFRARESFWKTLPLVCLDKKVQVELVHALMDVVPVGCDQFLVVVDLRLRR